RRGRMQRLTNLTAVTHHQEGTRMERYRAALASASPGIGLRPQWAERGLIALLAADLLLFAGGATAHSGIHIPFGFGTWVEPLLVPAAIIEGVGAAGLAATLISLGSRAPWAGRLAWWVLWYCFAGVLWGMGRLAVGSIPEARTM